MTRRNNDAFGSVKYDSLSRNDRASQDAPNDAIIPLDAMNASDEGIVRPELSENGSDQGGSWSRIEDPARELQLFLTSELLPEN